MITVPIFALDSASTWDDMENAMAGSAEYQSSQRGKILPLMLFAPMTEPENPDAWEPMKAVPENLLMISIERSMDRRILKALDQAKGTCGELCQAGTFPIRVHTDFKGALADIYQQMAAAKIQAFAHTFSDKDAPSFFFLRGEVAVRAFDAAFSKLAR